MAFNNPFEKFFPAKSEESPRENIVSVTETRIESEPVFPVGAYKLRATFKKDTGEVKTMYSPFGLQLAEPATSEELEIKANGDVSFMGIHNFGMDVHAEQYKQGHPVSVEVLDENSNPVHTYTQVFNASGHPVINTN